ncbi:hypothetical protein SAMN05444920_109179 [Nonomuraea solani]|uniref:Uncharacterized protein n=1 Tax=Nonomuraea solani TaxID=1144553 RepID=A0A1H6EF03_9ACTN|nr:hypothetical protein [Nonomuraea solani]SEG95843.1 hypothetical protein SAMN05444920_109179 [Nonomuraea solani]
MNFSKSRARVIACLLVLGSAAENATITQGVVESNRGDTIRRSNIP